MADYQPPVSQLLKLGRPAADKNRDADWVDPVSLGIGQEHIADLIRMMTDPELQITSENDFYATIHAHRMLAKLGAKDAILPFLKQFDDPDFSDWLTEDGRYVLVQMGVDCIPLYAQLLSDTSLDVFARWALAGALRLLAERNPERRSEVIAILQSHLTSGDKELNGGIVIELADLRAVEAYPAIEQVYQQGLVDETMVDLNGVRESFGMEPLPEDPEQIMARRERWEEKFGVVSEIANLLKQAGTHQRKAKDKVKAKRKQQRVARKKNRKKK